MIVAALDICHSRPIAPTRRIALGARNLPIDPAPGAGGVLLAGIVAANAHNVAGDLRAPVMKVLTELEVNGRVRQPVARHRYQKDRVGLTCSPQRLVAVDGQLDFQLDLHNAAPVQLVLGALYAAVATPVDLHPKLFSALRLGLAWKRPVDTNFISTVMDGNVGGLDGLHAWNNPVRWAMEILEFDDDNPGRRSVLKKYRSMLRSAHPDHGGVGAEAADRISDLTKARDILLAP